MKNKNNAETLLKTDKAIFYYVWQEMKKQGEKSVDTWYDEETGEEMPGDENKYFGWSAANDQAARCALGFIMNRGIAEDFEVEDKCAADDDVLSTIIMSNPEWNFTSSSAKLVMLLQLIHDNYPVESWDKAFELYQKDFDENGRFTGLDDIEYVSDDSLREINIGERTITFNSVIGCSVKDALRYKFEDYFVNINKTENEVLKDVVHEKQSEMV